MVAPGHGDPRERDAFAQSSHSTDRFEDWLHRVLESQNRCRRFPFSFGCFSGLTFFEDWFRFTRSRAITDVDLTTRMDEDVPVFERATQRRLLVGRSVVSIEHLRDGIEVDRLIEWTDIGGFHAVCSGDRTDNGVSNTTPVLGIVPRFDDRCTTSLQSQLRP